MRVLTADGEIELERRYFWAKGCGGVFPADASVGIERGRASPGAREILCRLGMVQDFRQAADDAKRIGNVPVGKEKLRQLVESEAATVAQARNSGKLKAAWTSVDAKVQVGGAGGSLTRVYVGVDGVMAPTVTQQEKDKRRKAQSIRRQQRSACGVGNAKPLPPGKVDDAAACYRKAIALDPKHADAHSNLGSALSEQRKPDEAIAWYRKAIEIDPKHVNAHTYLGNRFYQQGKLDEAIAWYRKALEIDPKDAGAQYGVGIVLKAQGKVEEAITYFRKVIEADPKHANAHTARANSLKSLHAVRLQHFQKAKNAAGCRATAEMWEKLKRTDPGSLYDAACFRAVTAEVIKQDPKTPVADATRLAGEEADRAMAWLEQAVAAGFSDVEHMKTRDADLHVLRERADFQKLVAESERKRSAATESAVEDNARLLRAQPGNDALLASRASLLVQLNRHGEAEAAYRAAIRVSPEDASLHHGLGDVLLKLAKPADGAVAYAEAIRLRPGDHASHYGLGSAYAVGGDWEEAAAAFRRAAELKPDDLPILFKTAALSLYTNDVETYRRACQALAEQFGKTDNIQVADCTIKACALTPGFGADAQKVTKLADAAVFQTQTGPARDWFEIARALVELRAGRFESAAAIVERSTPTHDIHRDALAFSILAMAQHHLGKLDEARVALSHAQGVISTKMPKVEAGENFGEDWHDWLHAKILCREAEKLLTGPKLPDR